MNFKVLGIEHIGLAQKSENGELSLFLKDVLQLSRNVETVEEQKVLTEIFDTGSGKIELLSATESDSLITKYLSKKGQSAHHIALLVDNLDEALKYLKSKNIKLIDEVPKLGADNMRIAFIHPSSTPGILLELCQKA
tara:strand:- start:119 stop:529 length:411 start_codon:yes stop_codon:yes gene_type:complete